MDCFGFGHWMQGAIVCFPEGLVVAVVRGHSDQGRRWGGIDAAGANARAVRQRNGRVGGLGGA